MDARESFANGYAVSGVLPMPRWVLASARAAIETAGDDPQMLPLVEATGRTEGRRAALERRRLRLYRKHRTTILALTQLLVADLNRDDLLHSLATVVGITYEDDSDRQRRRDEATAVALALLTRTMLTTGGLARAWQRANLTAYIDTTAEGQAQALTSPATGGPADPAKVAAASLAIPRESLATAGAWQTADTWTAQQLAGLAGDVANAALRAADADALRLGVDAALRNATGVAFYLEDEMHRAAAGGFAVLLATSTATINFLSVGDGRVCPTCAGYAGASPWEPRDVPVPPVHGTCRCWLEYAGDGVPAQGDLADLLV